MSDIYSDCSVCDDPCEPNETLCVKHNDRQIKAGQRFYHAKWLDPTTMGPNPQPALMQVTRVTKDAIYYGWIHNYGDREELGKSREWATPERFANHCFLRWA